MFGDLQAIQDQKDLLENRNAEVGINKVRADRIEGLDHAIVLIEQTREMTNHIQNPINE